MPGAGNFFQNRADLSQFLVHLTKDGSYENWVPKTVPGGPPGYDIATYPAVRAKNSLIDILNTRTILARSPFGYFKLKINRYRAQFNQVFVNGHADPNWLMSVCFSEAPLRELRSFYQATIRKRNRYKKYGLAFWQEHVRAAGGNPIFYVDSRNTNLLNSLNTSLTNNNPAFIPMMHLCETFGPQIVNPSSMSDFRWEREWRKLNDYTFVWENVAFGICPAEEITYFEALAQNQVIFIDPDWDEPTLRAYLQGKAPRLLSHL
ncbi:hypothetical protein [Bdellovibrio bacteriovorus]|uniref:hypothetical protein n=1 Tax=Bdellovibrio bacteriovorus TaxID=959 RepID=UPI0035A60F43